jgi:PAS domain-containing protein
MASDTATKSPADKLLASAPGSSDNASRTPAARTRAHVARTLIPNDAFNAVFDSSADALVLIDSAGVIQRANVRAREVLRLQEAGKRKSGLAEIFPRTDSGELSQLWRRAVVSPCA